MQCPACHHEALEGARFCEQCGAAFPGACRACNAALPPTARFCSSCGAAQEGAPSAPVVEPDETAERRLVTILFSDLVGSTQLSHRLDPEELRELVNEYHEVCSEEIERFGGYVAQYLGDGILAFFGYPVAHERDAQAAVQAGLVLLERMERRRNRGSGEPISVRVGVHSGLVVAGEVGAGDKRERLAIGSTPNVASRVQGVANPDTLVISESTHRLAGGFFNCVDLGVQQMKGVEKGLRCFEVRGGSDARTPMHAKPAATLSPLIGRETEISVLANAWDAACDGRGSAVLIQGEAGLGKSRLLLEQRNRLARTAHRVLECSCSPFTESSAFFPIVDALQREWALTASDAPGERLTRLRAAVDESLAGVEDALQILAPFLGVPLPSNEPPLELTPQRLKERTLDVLGSLLDGMSEHAPFLFVVEDLHWMDPSTQELLDAVVAKVARTPMLVLLLFRPNFDCPWQEAESVARIDLSRLGPEDTKALIRTVTRGRDLPPEILAEILERVDGVPLYVEEITKMVLESEAVMETNGRYELRGLPGTPTVPPTLQESLMARLDRVAQAKEVVQFGAMLGRSFPVELIRAVSGLEEESLQRELNQLIDAEILYRDPNDPGTYVFKHALIQDAAYESILREKRRQQHLRIAEVIEGEFPALADAHPELLLHHWGTALRPAEAIPYALTAGARAKERSALVEARTHLRRGLALHETLDDVVLAARLELKLLLELGPVLVSTQGYSNPEVEAVYARARELCEEAGGDLALRFTVLSGLLLFHQSRAELELCVELTRQRMEIARKLGNSDMEMLCHENLGTLAIWRGDHEYALGELRDSLSRYTPEGGRAMRLAYGTDVSVVSRAYEAQALVFLGQLDLAHETALESISVARELGHVGSLALALNFGAGMCSELGQAEVALELANETHGLASREHLAMWLGAAVAQRARALTLLGDPEGAITAVFEGTATMQAAGSTIGGRFFAAALGDAFLAANRAEEGIGIFEGVLGTLAHCEDGFYDPAVLRIRGSFHRALSPDQPEIAEGHYLDGIDLAKRHQNRLLEIRAATELADLWQARDRREDAVQLLSPLYENFSEGFGWLPLRQAKLLLDTLDA